MMNPKRTNKMNTEVLRSFRKTQDGLYREVYMHYLQFLDQEGNVVSSKLDKQIPGRLYKDATDTGERSNCGEVEYEFPNGEVRRLIALNMDYQDQYYGQKSVKKW